MSIECSHVVWSRNFSGASRKMVAVKLADHADDKGRGIWPSVESIAAKCDLSCRTVQRVLSDFVKEGILRVVSDGGNGPGDTRRYDFDMAIVRSLPMAVAPPDSRTVRPEIKGDTVSPIAEPKGDIDDAKGDTDDAEGCHGVTQTVIEPPIEPSLERERASEGPKQEYQDDLSSFDDMLRSMRKWPTGFDDSKQEAFREWKKLTTEDRRKVDQHLPAYLAAKKAVGRSKFGAFSTFLAERRIDDIELATGKASGEGPKPAAPFGKAWIAAFLRIIADRPGPLPAPPPANRWLIDQDPDREIPLRNEHRLKYGWPAANNMLEKLRAIPPRPVIVDAHIGRLGTDFQQVAKDSAIDLAWDRLAAKLVIPWLPKHRPEWIWLPPLPAGADDLPEHELDRAVATAFEDFKRKVGHEHAA